MKRQLSDTDMYQLLNRNPIFKFKKELDRLIKKGERRDTITRKEALDLSTVACRTPIIYFLPKIHKDLARPLADRSLTG